MKLTYPEKLFVYDRDFRFLHGYLVAQEQVKVADYIGFGFDYMGFVFTEPKCTFAFSEDVRAQFAQTVGEKAVTDPTYARSISEKLATLTDTFDVFLKENPKLTKENVKAFFALYSEHFAYHVAGYWMVQHALEQDSSAELEITKLCAETRTRNEHVLPDVDAWIARQAEPVPLFTPSEVESFLSDGSLPDEKTLTERKRCWYSYFTHDAVTVLTGDDATKEYEHLLDLYARRADTFDGTTLRGVSVVPGKVSGRAYVASSYEELKGIAEGDILIAPNTRPQYTQFIKKASAIVTDEGGLLNHAAIVAREFNIPAIVGTKVGTHIFKTGDMVEVDGREGTVRKV